MTLFFVGFLYDTVEHESRNVHAANGKLLPLVGCGKVEIVAEYPKGPVTFSLGKVLNGPKLERNFISERQASLISELLLVKSLMDAHLGTGKDMCFFFSLFFSYSPSSGLYEMTAMKRKQYQSARGSDFAAAT